MNPELESKKSNSKVGIIGCCLLFVLIFYICLPSAVVIGRFLPQIVTQIQETIDSGAINDLSSLFQRNYIDPDFDPQAEQLVEQSQEHFDFKFDNSVTTPDFYNYEKSFLLANLENEYVKFAILFGDDVYGKIHVTYYDSQEAFESAYNSDYQFTITQAGFALSGDLHFFIDSTVDISRDSLNRLVKHELVHIFQYKSNPFLTSDVPIWFYEGSAEYFASDSLIGVYGDPIIDEVQTLDELSAYFDANNYEQANAAYEVSHMFINYLANKYGRDSLIELHKTVTYRDFEQHFFETYSVTPEDAFSLWLSSE